MNSVEVLDMIVKTYVEKANGWDFLPSRFHRLVCQIVTLSRYVHAFMIIKHKNHFFKLESSVGGIFLEKVGPKSVQVQVASNKTDVFKHQVSSRFSKEIKSDLDMMISTETRILKIGNYSYASLFNQFLIKVFKISLIKESKLNGIYPDKMTCSEFVHYFHTGRKNSYLVAPVDIAVNNDNYKKLK